MQHMGHKRRAKNEGACQLRPVIKSLFNLFFSKKEREVTREKGKVGEKKKFNT